MKTPHVLFIDDGIDVCHFSFDIKYNLEIDSNNRVINRKLKHVKELTHGSICAAIVQKYSPNFICSSLKILNSYNKKSTISKLVVALEWCLSKNEFDIINMSIGSTHFFDYDRLKKIINELSNRTILVAALSNNFILTYPASFGSVIGVVRNNSNNNMQYVDCSLYGINFKAKSQHTLTTIQGYSFLTDRVNSFAAPYVVSQIIIHNVYEKKSSEIIKYFSGLKQYTPSFPDYFSSADIVSFGREKFESNLFDIDNFYCIKQKKDLLSACIDIKKNHKKKLLVIILYRDLSKDIIKTLTKLTNYYNHLIVVEAKKTHIKFKKLNTAIQYMSTYRYSYYTMYKNNNLIQLPIIIIESFLDEETFKFTNFFSFFFKEKGYFPCIMFDTPLAILHGYYYAKKNNISFIQETCRACCADLLVLCSTFKRKNFDFFKKNTDLKPDIIVKIKTQQIQLYSAESEDVLYSSLLDSAKYKECIQMIFSILSK